MNIDERLEKLTERHEALIQTVELLAAAQRETDKRHAGVVDTLVRIEGNTLDNELQINKLTATVDRLAETVDRYIAARGNGNSGH